MLLCIILHILFYCYYVLLLFTVTLIKKLKDTTQDCQIFFFIYNVVKNIDENKYIK